ncbi:hypothetical protein Nepgr_018206 [Nepenthes gracilis]|uniref:Uncharacterized protein n=1 Tax=Nepenthes gracilis TaxID=150966 RepID=A0AAD3XU27_NEPGR|nr:hypothetical protein Nepgr_018206 [Nepenthes gracilis]
MGRSPCCERAHTNKGAWTKEEDDRLIAYIKAHGEGCWRSLPKAAGLLRCGKSCRLRWINYLRPDLKRGNFTKEEDELIIKLHSLLGNKWSLIAGRLPGRTDNEIKNYWNTHIKRKLLSWGIDPATHGPLSSEASPAADATAIAFTAADHPKQEATAEKIMEVSDPNDDKNPGREDRERCPDLNLELRISPPNYQHQPEALKTGGRRRNSSNSRSSSILCFTCSMGLTNRQECTCDNRSSTVDSNINIDYHDFLGLRTGADISGIPTEEKLQESVEMDDFQGALPPNHKLLLKSINLPASRLARHLFGLYGHVQRMTSSAVKYYTQPRGFSRKKRIHIVFLMPTDLTSKLVHDGLNTSRKKQMLAANGMQMRNLHCPAQLLVGYTRKVQFSLGQLAVFNVPAEVTIWDGSQGFPYFERHGQGYVKDPYHGPGRVIGLAFFVPKGVKIRSSLVNVFNAYSLLQVKYADDELERLDHKLFVGMLPKNVTESEVSALPSQYGTINKLQILRGSQQTCKACSFLKYETKDQALAALEKWTA